MRYYTGTDRVVKNDSHGVYTYNSCVKKAIFETINFSKLF